MNLILNQELDNFQDVYLFLSWIPSINLGGCGVAALSMYRWLEKNEGQRPPIILLYSSERRYNSNLKYLEKGKKRNLQIPNHCVIGYPFEDFNEIIKKWSYEFYWNQITDEEGILKMLNNGKNWGHRFNRENIPKISERLGIDLSDVCLR